MVGAVLRIMSGRSVHERGSGCGVTSPLQSNQGSDCTHVAMFQALANFLDTRRGDRSAVCGMRKLQAHPSSYETRLERGPSPGGTGDRDQNRFGAVFGMPDCGGSLCG